jgi:hypothetical protein
MCKRINWFYIRKTERRRDSLGINNVGLMARALVLKDGASPDEQEYMKWQTLQVSAFSIASCIGRVLIGTYLPEVQVF